MAFGAGTIAPIKVLPLSPLWGWQKVQDVRLPACETRARRDDRDDIRKRVTVLGVPFTHGWTHRGREGGGEVERLVLGSRRKAS